MTFLFQSLALVGQVFAFVFTVRLLRLAGRPKAGAYFIAAVSLLLMRSLLVVLKPDPSADQNQFALYGELCLTLFALFAALGTYLLRVHVRTNVLARWTPGDPSSDNAEIGMDTVGAPQATPQSAPSMDEGDAQILCNSGMEVTELNQAAARLLDRDRQDFYGKSISNFVRREEMLLVPELFREVAAGMASSSEWNFRKPDETLVPVRISPRSHFNDQVRLILQDLTEERAQQRTEVDSSKQDSIMAQLLDSAVDGYVAYDSDLKVIGWNRAMENLSGVPRSQCMNQHLLMHFPIPDELAEEDFIQEALEGHTHDLSDTELANSKTGESQSVNHHFGPLGNAAGEIIGGMIRVSRSQPTANTPAESTEPPPAPEADIAIEAPIATEPQPEASATEETPEVISMPDLQPSTAATEESDELQISMAAEVDEEALHAKRILQAAPQLISSFDLMAHKETYANRPLAIELGFAPDLVETMGDSVLSEIVHPEDQQNLPRHAEEWLGASDGERRVSEYRVADPDQNWHWFQTTDAVLDRSDDGVVTSIVSITEDISTRKALELQLRKSEQKQPLSPEPAPESEATAEVVEPEPLPVLAAEIKPSEPTVSGPVAQPAFDGYVTYDHDLKITQWNEAMVEFTSTPIEQCLGQHLLMHFPIPDELAEEDYILEALEGHSETIDEASVLNPQSGDTAVFKYEFGPLTDLSGTVVGGFIHMTTQAAKPAAEVAAETPPADTTPAPESEPIKPNPELLIESTPEPAISMPAVPPMEGPVDEEAELAKRILDAAPQLVTAYNLIDGRQTFANRELALQVGFPQEQLDAMGDDVLQEIVHPEDQQDLPRSAEQWAGAPDSERRVTEYRVSDPERRWHWFQSTDSVLERDDDGNVSSIVSITEEITERKEQERQLRLGEQKYRTFAEHCPTGIWHLTAGGRTHYLNPAMCELLGAKSPSDIEGYTYQQFITEESQQTIAKQANEEGNATDFAIDIQTLDGSIRHCILYGAPELDESGQIRNLMGSVLDVTERTEAERLLSAQEARYRAIVEQTPDLICRFDQDGILSFVNGAYAEFFGEPRNELLGGSFAPRIPDEEAAVIAEMLSTLEPTMEPRQFHCRVFRADNEERWTRWTLHAVSDDTGSFIEYQAIARDVTKTRAAEQALTESEEKFRGIFEQTNLGIFIVDTEGRFTAMNAAYTAMTGRPTEELIGNICTTISHPESHEESQRLLGALLTGEKESAEMEKRYILPDDSEAWVQLNARGIRNRDGEVTHLICTAKDVTQSREAHEKLEHSERKHRHLIEHHPFAIVVADHNRILFENPAAEPLFGHGEPDAERNLTNLLPQDSLEEINRCVEQAIEEGEDTELHEATFRRHDGSLFAAEFAAMPVEFEGTIAAQLVVRDITARRTAENALRESEKQLREKEALLLAAINNLPFDLWACDLSSHYILQNESSRERWGDRIGKKPEETGADPKIVKLWHENNHRALQGETVVEHVRYHHDEDLRDFQSIVGPIRQGDDIVGFLGANIDITDLKTAENQLVEAETKLQSADAELGELRTTLDECSASLRKAEEARDSFKTDYENVGAELTAAKSAQSEAESDSELAESLLKETEADLAEAKTSLQETESKLQEARQSLEDKEAVRLEVETSQASTAEELANIAAQLAAAEAARDEIRSEVDSLQTELAKATKTNEDTQAELDLTTESLSKSDAARNQAEADLTEARTANSEKDAALQQAEESRTQLEAELEKNAQALADTESERGDALESLTKAESDLQAANARVVELESAATASEKAVEEANNKVAETDSRCQETEAARSETASRLSEAETAREEATARIEFLESAKADADAKAADLRRQLEELNEKLLLSEEAVTASDTPSLVQLDVPAENLVNELPEMVWMSAADGQRGFFNEAWLEFTGRTSDESLGSNWRDAIHGQDRDGVIRTIQHAVENQEAFSIEYRLRAQDGTYHWVEDAGVPRKDADGKVTDYLGSTHDITAQIRREEELKAGMRQLEWAQSRAKLGSWEYRPRGDHRQWSRQTFELYHRSANEGTPETYEDFLQLIHEEDRDKLRRANEKVLKTGQPLSNLEYRTSPETGPVRYLSASTYRIPEQDGSAYYLGGTVIDVTEQKAAAEIVRRSEERYRKIIEVAEEGVWMMDMEGYTSFVNPRMMRMLGYKYREFIGRHFFEFLESESLKEAEEYMERREKGITEQAEFTFLRKNGQPVNVFITSSTLADADGDYVGVLSFVSDISERKADASKRDESERAMNSILACVPNLIVTVDEKRIVQFANRDHAGMRPDQIIGTPALNWIAPDYRESFEEAVDASFASGDTRQIEVEGLGSDGAQVQYRCHFSAIGKGEKPDSVAIAFAPLGPVRATPEPAEATATTAAADDKLTTLTQKLFAAEEAERRRIASELHDEFGQALSAAKINLQSLAKTKQTDKNQERLSGSLESLEKLIQRVRKLAEELRPSILDDLGLEAALRWLVDQQADSAGFTADFSAVEIGRLESDLESAVFRIAEAALDNITRHAGAKNIAVKVDKNDNRIVLTIQDDGKGFDASSAKPGIGIPGMEQRARLVGGAFDITARPEGGTTIEFSVPLPATKPTAKRKTKAKAKTKRRRKKK